MEHLVEMEPGEDDLPLGRHPLAFVAVLLGVLALGYLSTNLFFQRVGAASLEAGPALSEVPEVIGLERERAIAALEDAGFTVSTQSVPNASVPAGQVTDQSPTAGTRSESGSEVIIVISAGDGFVRVPDVRGSPFDELQFLLFTQGLAIGEVTEAESDLAEGEVVSQDPNPGETVAGGTEVRVVVSSGPPMIEIPDIEGLDARDAAQLMRQAGFEVVYRDRYSSRIKRGHVIGTDPEDEAPRGSRITLDISLGPAPPRPTVVETPDPSTPPPSTTPPAGRETFAPSVPGGVIQPNP